MCVVHKCGCVCRGGGGGQGDFHVFEDVHVCVSYMLVLVWCSCGKHVVVTYCFLAGSIALFSLHNTIQYHGFSLG